MSIEDLAAGAILLMAAHAPLQALAAPMSVGAVAGECPDGYQVKSGLNTNFPTEGKMRAFIVVPPTDIPDHY